MKKNWFHDLRKRYTRSTVMVLFTLSCADSHSHTGVHRNAQRVECNRKKNIHKIMYREGNGKEIKNLVFAMHKHTKKINPRNDGEKNMHT